MKYILIVFILFSTSSLFAQKLYTRNVSVPITQDSVTIQAGEYRGKIQWQKSLDNTNWINLVGKNTSIIKVKSDSEAMYRALITEGTCLSIYSDTAIIAFTVPEITTSNAEEIATNSVLIGGNIVNNGGTSLYERGICYSLTQNPTIANAKVIIGSGTGLYRSTISGLNPNTTYYFRAYATNSVGTAYGSEVSFKTSATILLPTLSTSPITSITTTSATSGGNISSDGGATITSRGVCWSTSFLPTISNSKTTDGNGTGSFSSSITGLDQGTTYYFRAYATNSAGTAYGNEVSFTTSVAVQLPTLSTISVTSIILTSATSGGNISSDGGATITARGICWSTSSLPTIVNNKTTDGNGTGSFSSSITGLTQGTTYYIRAYATNSAGTAYGNEVSFKTSVAVQLPTVSTISVTSITSTSATSGGNIFSDGGATITAHGICWSTSSLPTISNSKTTDGIGTGSFSSSITGLTQSTTYYIRAYATNSAGTAYGNEISFKTSVAVQLPTLSTISVTSISQTSATSGGNFLSDSGATITARGVCWSTTENPTTANSKTNDGTYAGSFTSDLTDLTANTTYYVRAYATNSVGTAYGDQISFKTSFALETGTVTDCEGNTYKTVKIGNQWWMAQNLAYLPAVYPSSNCSSIDPRYYVYGYNGTDVAAAKNNANYSTYGVLYNWPAALAACPAGWHLPSDDEWKQMEMALGMTQAQADAVGWRGTDQSVQMKATSGWNYNGTNASGFAALPAGVGSPGTSCWGSGEVGYWWSSDEKLPIYGYCRSMEILNNRVGRNYWSKDYGFSVRFVKDHNEAVVPYLSTTSARNITQFSATIDGNITYDGGAIVTARGVCWSTSENPTTATSKTDNGAGTGSFTANLTGLTANTTYYVRVYATNSVGTGYGNQRTFTTGGTATMPIVTTDAINSITQTSASCGGNVTNDGGSTVTARGVCWNTLGNPTTANSKTTIGSGTGSFTLCLTGLAANTTWYVRAYATNSEGTAYGDQQTFTTNSRAAIETGTVTDIDGNVYQTVKIGDQWWMAENLKTTKYNDGKDIPNVTDGNIWRGLSTPAYCWYNNDAATNKNTYGALYNAYSVITGKLAPTGWHVPTDAEWITLTNYLANNGYGYGCINRNNIAKSMAGTSGWTANGREGTVGNDQASNNSSGFTALPGGFRNIDGYFFDIRNNGQWWSSTILVDNVSDPVWVRAISSSSYSVSIIYLYKQYGYSVRCVKD